MPLGFSGNLQLKLASKLTQALDLSTPESELDYSKTFNFTSGSGSAQAQELFQDERTLAASASESLDLGGALTDAFGQTVTLTKIKALIVYAHATNTNDLHLDQSVVNGVTSPFGNATSKIVIPPGALIALVNPAGYTVTAATADLLKFTNSAAGTDVTYDIIVVGS